MLLTGDIEKGAEGVLSEGRVRADVLLVPHHGSKTSSTERFIAAVAPRWAVVAAGYRNRFGHPNEQVLERYRAAGVEVRRTDREGALQVVLEEQPSLAGERARRGRYWLQ
jgi:competence protein ComEC